MAKPAFQVEHNGEVYEIAREVLPCKGKHDAATNVRMESHPTFGDYLRFKVKCNSKSPEAGHCYNVQYFLVDGYVQYYTVN